jgi:glutamyl-tRNA synthetase
LSKRHGATSLLEYRNDGFLPEALMNYLARLGWAYGDQEVFSRQDLIKKFDLKNVGRSPSIFDMDKLLWLNGHYLKTLPEADIAARLEPFIENRGIKVTDREKLIPVVINLRDRAKTLKEMAEMAAFFFTDDFAYDENAKNKFLTPATKPILEKFLAQFTRLATFDENEQRRFFEAMAQESNRKLAEVIQPIRVALCGKTVSPGIFEVVSILGQESVAKRIQKAIASIA